MRKKEQLKVLNYVDTLEQNVASYHCSNHEQMLVFTSDRKKLMNEMQPNQIKGIGIELELTCTGINNDTALMHAFKMIIQSCNIDVDLFRVEEDGSLSDGCSSIEAPSQVATIEAWNNMQPKLEKMYSYFEIFGISQTACCGCHFNISKALFGKDEKQQLKTIARVIRVIEFNFNTWCNKLGRRADRTRYCGKLRAQGAGTIPQNTAEIEKELNNAKDNATLWNKYNFNGSHYYWINLKHFNQKDRWTGERKPYEDRVEIRLPAGMNSAQQLIDRLNLVYNLILDAKQMSAKDFNTKYNVIE